MQPMQVRRGYTGEGTTQADAANLSYLRVPTRIELMNRLIFDARLLGVELTMAGADSIIELWERARRDADRAAQQDPANDARMVETLLTDDETEHCALAISRLMPDNVIAVPGSVHAVLNAFTFGVHPTTHWPVRGVMLAADQTDGLASVLVVV